jgi:peptidyl-prolyl cis-trans isomerase A (cyclophilin A)
LGPRVRIITDLGDLVVELRPDRAPQSVSAFLEEVMGGSYDGGSFCRIVRADNDHGSPVIEVIQGISGSTGQPRADVPLETTADTGLRHLNGTISLPRFDTPMSTAHGFFICIGDQPGLDHGASRSADGLGFAAFGRLIDGMGVARAIHAIPTEGAAPTDYVEGQIPTEAVAIYRVALEADTPSGLLRDLAEDYRRFRKPEFPVEASFSGLGEANRRMDRICLVDHARRARLSRAMLVRADRIDTTALSTGQSTTLALLRQQLTTIVEAFAMGGHEAATSERTERR